MDWVGSCKVLLNRPKVVHRLPGRLRVHLPFLQKLPAGEQVRADRIATLLSMPDEITSAAANLTTGNTLICYDPLKVTEKDVLEYLRAMLEIFVRNRERFEGITLESEDRVFEKLQALLKDAVQPRLKVDSKLVLEEDVLE